MISRLGCVAVVVVLVGCGSPPSTDDAGSGGGATAGGSGGSGGTGGTGGTGGSGGSGGGSAGGAAGGAAGGSSGGSAGGTAGGMSGATVVDLVDAGPAVRIMGGFQFLEGPQWVPAMNALLFSDIFNPGRIHQLTPPSTITVFRADSNRSNGITLAPNGDLIICEHAGRVTRTQPDGGQSIVAATFNGMTLNSPNDAVVRSDGTIYFTDPSYGGTGTVGTRGVYRVAPGGALSRFYATANGQPNGVTLSPDEKILYVADSQLSTVRRFDLAPDGAPDGGQLFVNTTMGGPGGNGGDGITTDDNGYLYVTTSAGVKVWKPDAGYHGVISVGRQPANCAFGDPDRRTLYITAQDQLFRVRLNVTGPY